MACKAPIRVYAAAGGGRVKFWKRTDKQYWIEPYTGQTIPCGTCILCREEQARQQAVRITHEATQWLDNAFITPTYDDENLPEYSSLNYTHLTLFLKRLRKRLGKLRYYAVGEYGDKNNRPHYHLCIFGHAFTEHRIIEQTEPYLLWTCPWLNEAWGLGKVKVGALNFQTARYTASYVTKKLRAKQKYVRIDEQTGELVPLVQPHAFMSDNLGKGWWEQWGKQIEDHDYVVIEGKKQKPPKAYDKWLLAKNPAKAEENKEKRRKKAKQQTKEQTHARAKNAHARAKVNERNKLKKI